LSSVDSMLEQWYAVRVKSNCEYVTYTSLLHRDYELFLPTYRPSKASQSAADKRVPLFPGYLFCKIRITERLPILMLPGVVHFVGLGKTPTPIDNGEIESLRVLVDSAVSVNLTEYFSVGQKIRITRGPLAGAVGFVSGTRRNRLVVSITLLQRSVTAELDPEWVDAAGSGEPDGFRPLRAGV
jgi:transcriptional antiterminator NusG